MAIMDTATPAGLRVNTIVLAFTLVSGMIVFLRMFTRLVISKGAGFEDVCIVLAMVSKPWRPMHQVAKTL
jgi:hypothetical protein